MIFYSGFALACLLLAYIVVKTNAGPAIGRFSSVLAGCDNARQLDAAIRDTLKRYCGISVSGLYVSADFLWKSGHGLYYVDLTHRDNLITEHLLPEVPDGMMLSVLNGRAVYPARALRALLPGAPLEPVSAMIPILYRDQAVGVLVLGRHEQGDYTKAERHRLRELGHQLGPVLARLIALQIARTNLHRQAQYERLVNDMKRIIHDLKNPISGIAGAMALPTLSPEARDRIVMEEAKDALNLLDQALDALRGRKKYTAFLHLNSIVRRVAARYHLSVMTLELNDLPHFYGNAWEMESLVDNLLKNAVEAEGVKGREQSITVITRYDAECRHIVCQVRDRGNGIPADILPLIWEGDITTKRHGSGVGLSVVKYIVDQYGGSVSVDSVPGKGTTFTFSLPVAESDAGPDRIGWKALS